MAKLKDMTNTVVTRAKAGQKAVTNAATAAAPAVTRARVGASTLALKASENLAPAPQKGKGVKRALVAAGAVLAPPWSPQRVWVQRGRGSGSLFRT